MTKGSRFGCRFAQVGFMLIASLLASGAAHAALVKWTLESVAFDDGTVASGYFLYNAGSNRIASYAIEVSAGAGGALGLPGYYYAPQPGPNSTGAGFVDFPGNASAPQTLRFSWIIGSPPLQRELRLSPVIALPEDGGWISLLLDGSFLTSGERYSGVSDDFSRVVVSGGLAGSPVPAPAAGWLLGSALVGMGGLRRRFRK